MKNSDIAIRLMISDPHPDFLLVDGCYSNEHLTVMLKRDEASATAIGHAADYIVDDFRKKEAESNG